MLGIRRCILGRVCYCSGSKPDTRRNPIEVRSARMSARLRRSELSVPGSNPKMIEKAIASAADLVFLDLEDAVAPALKESSRANVIAALKSPDWGRKLRAVRVN